MSNSSDEKYDSSRIFDKFVKGGENCAKCMINTTYYINIDNNNICYNCYFNIKYKNNENFDGLINNDKIDIYEYVKMFIKKHMGCKLSKCLLCDINNNIIIKNLKYGYKIYGKYYRNIKNTQIILYEESLNINTLINNI